MKRLQSGLIILVALVLALTSLLSACAAPAGTPTAPATTTAPTTTKPGTTTAPTATTTAPGTTTSSGAKPQGSFTAVVQGLANENFLPWVGSNEAFDLSLLVNDNLIYYEETTGQLIPGLAERWTTSPDALTTTFYIRKGVQFQGGWGELTAADVKFTIEKDASPTGTGVTATASRNIKSMDMPDPYTLVVNLKTPNPIFALTFSYGVGALGQGIACKKYVETVGDTVANQKPIGSGPYKLVEGKLGDHYTFEALDSHWRVVPEFKNVTLRIIPELSTLVAMLKTGEADMASVSAENIPELKAAGLGTEMNSYGGSIVIFGFGGIFSTTDPRYKAGYHNQDPWVDVKVRQAMNISIDRAAIASAIYQGSASPSGASYIYPGAEKYQYPYDPAKARQLLIQAGYPNGFKLDFYSFVLPGRPEVPRVIEAAVSYWLAIGLHPRIVTTDMATYRLSHWIPGKTAGEIAPFKNSAYADVLSMVPTCFTDSCNIPLYIDDTTNAMYKAGNLLVDPAARMAAADKLQQYLYDIYAPIPTVRVAYTYAWNAKNLSPFPYAMTNVPLYLEYVRHATPLNTFRLFTPWAGR